jgi:Sulfite exporter TauE/SafE
VIAYLCLQTLTAESTRITASRGSSTGEGTSVLVLGHNAAASGALLTGAAQMATGVVAGFVIGVVAALLGVAGGELLIPTLILLFGADIKLAGSLVGKLTASESVVASALPFRASTVPFSTIAANWPIIVNLLAGSLVGAWFGAGWATKLASHTLYRVIAILLVVIAIDEAHGLVENYRLQGREPEDPDQQRQPELSTAQPDQAADRTDDRATCEGGRAATCRRQGRDRHDDGSGALLRRQDATLAFGRLQFGSAGCLPDQPDQVVVRIDSP